MRITAIERQKESAERVNVFVDGEFRLALAAEIAYGALLRVGHSVSDQELRKLEQRDLIWKAKEAALNLLSYRMRTRTELQHRLRKKGFEDGVIDSCLGDLMERGLIDDAVFAEAFARDRVRLKPKGKRRIIQELRAKGVRHDAAREAVDRVWSEEEVSEIDLAREAANKWSMRPREDPQRARRRLFGYLSRRGFGSEVIRRVTAERMKNAE